MNLSDERMAVAHLWRWLHSAPLLRFMLLAAMLSVVACDRSQQASTTSSFEAEKRRWTVEGWSYVETIGTPANDATYITHISSETARSVTAFASAGGVRTNKVYAQTNALYLVVSMQRPSGDAFALVFTRPK